VGLGLEQKISIRRQFVAGQIDEPMAKVSIGAAAPLELKQAELKLYELEVELRKAELDLSVVRRQIDQRKGK